MRPQHPDWAEHFEFDITPSLKAGVIFELVKSEHIYLTAVQGDGAKFASNFQTCWSTLPLQISTALLNHWNMPRILAIKSYPYTPYFLLTDRLVGRADEGPGVTAAKVMDCGFFIQFWAPIFKKCPDEIATTLIAHELAHVYQYSQRKDPLKELGEGGMEREADMLLEAWNYDISSLERWACSVANNGPKTEAGVQEVVRRSKLTRYCPEKKGDSN
jgi:hypothetical protein